MASESPDFPEPNKGLFEAVVNRHGHAFQYAVIRLAHELRDKRRSPWVFEASEFPVEVQGFHTRIDFILSQRAEHHPQPFRYLVAECKRANPSLANWLFVRSPYVQRGRDSSEVLVERVRKDGSEMTAGLSRFSWTDNVFHLAFETKAEATGDPTGGSRGAIEEAATQVIRGVNGIIECFASNPKYLQDRWAVTFIPVIFTTAHLWSCDVDLGATSLTQGRVSFDAVPVVRQPWLWLQYHVSPGLKHRIAPEASKDEQWLPLDLGNLLESEYARTIAVVGADGVEAFLASTRWGV